MDDTSVRKGMPQRLLRLLSLLQSRRAWTGTELTERLGVSARTLRRDVDRLRSLDYQVEGVPGAAGGYRLVPGHELPPLLLDDEEAVAIGLGLVTVSGVGESALTALAKLQRVLPSRLRPRLAAVSDTATAVRRGDVPTVSPCDLAMLGSCCREHAVVDFDYRDREGRLRERRVEPHHLVDHQGRWYLVAHDTDRGDWRTFRVDRMDGIRRTHRRFTPRPLPAADPAEYVVRSFAGATHRHTARIGLGLSAETVRTRLHGPIPGAIEASAPDACVVRISADALDLVCQYTLAVISLGADFDIDAPPEVLDRLGSVTGRLADLLPERGGPVRR
ncbi:helix-turn-helix transcriptional regulator [Nocardiopsis sp. NPDC050513]|uniref:helix-turn-helix transcriptional regulator n=1 Tax=Nocardiopsis sp. NPDC050513 TaxID=3364338 RepID=UPI0037AF9945